MQLMVTTVYVFMNITSQSLLFLDFPSALLSHLQAWLILNKQVDHCSLKAGMLFQ